MTAAVVFSAPAPVLEPAAKRLAEESDLHPRVYELPLDQARAPFDRLQPGDGVARPDLDEEWIQVDAGQEGTGRARVVRPKNATATLPVFMSRRGRAVRGQTAGSRGGRHRSAGPRHGA